MKKLVDWLKEFFVGRELTKEDIFKDRMCYCAIGKILPRDIENFWDGIEELKLKYCAYCGKKLSERAQQIAKTIRPNYILCENCNPHPKSPF